MKVPIGTTHTNSFSFYQVYEGDVYFHGMCSKLWTPSLVKLCDMTIENGFIPVDRPSEKKLYRELISLIHAPYPGTTKHQNAINIITEFYEMRLQGAKSNE